MNILVTGSAGFLGSEVVKRLVQAGHYVFGLDIQPESQSHEHLAHDLSEPLQASLPNLDLVVHLASSVGGFLFNATNTEAEETELLYLNHVWELCRSNGCRRLLYSSSTRVFETSSQSHHEPLSDETAETPYARAKIRGELFVESHFEEFIIFRPSNLFGREQRSRGDRWGESHVIPELIEKIKTANALEVLGDGSQTRNFLHRNDVANFLLLTLQRPAVGWFTLVSHLDLRLSELAETLLTLQGVQRPIHYRPEYLRYEPSPLLKPDTDWLRQLGWKPQVQSLSHGLEF